MIKIVQSSSLVRKKNQKFYSSKEIYCIGSLLYFGCKRVDIHNMYKVTSAN